MTRKELQKEFKSQTKPGYFIDSYIKWLEDKIIGTKNAYLPPAEGAEANRANIDDLIKKHIPIDAANFEYCAKHNIINGGLLQGIRDVVNEFATLHAQRIADKMVEERLKEDTYMTCDVCGCHPSVIITTSFGKFCQQHAKYI